MPEAAATLHPRRLIEAMRDSPALLWAFLYFFFLLTGYYVLRPVRDAMGSVGNLQLLFTGTFVSMLLLQPVYGALVSRFPRRVFLPLVYVFFIGCLVGFYLLFGRDLAWAGSVFFVWVAVFNLFAVSVFWSFMADVFSDIEARKLYGYIGAGGTLGGFLGPAITKLMVDLVGVANLMLVSAVMLSFCLLCIVKLRPWARRREQVYGLNSDEQAIGGDVLAGLVLIWRQPLLRALALLLFSGIGGATLLYNEQAAIARAYFDTAEARTNYYSSIDLAINSLTLAIQLLLTRYLLTRYRLATVLLIPPTVIIIGFALLTASPLPILVAVVQIVLRAGEFSIMKPARETIYTRVEREWRYKAKGAIDTVVYRGADLTFVWAHKFLALGGSLTVFGAGLLLSIGFFYSAWRAGRAQEGLPVVPDPRGAPGTVS
jgi:AAA family ATP:ADP antiporter